MQTLSLVWGILAICGMLLAFFPCLGALNWINIPFAGVGIILCAVAWSTGGPQNQGQAEPASKNGSIAGLVMCLCAVVFGFIRLVLGAGVV